MLDACLQPHLAVLQELRALALVRLDMTEEAVQAAIQERTEVGSRGRG